MEKSFRNLHFISIGRSVGSLYFHWEFSRNEIGDNNKHQTYEKFGGSFHFKKMTVFLFGIFIFPVAAAVIVNDIFVKKKIPKASRDSILTMMF